MKNKYFTIFIFTITLFLSGISFVHAANYTTSYTYDSNIIDRQLTITEDKRFCVNDSCIDLSNFSYITTSVVNGHELIYSNIVDIAAFQGKWGEIMVVPVFSNVLDNTEKKYYYVEKYVVNYYYQFFPFRPDNGNYLFFELGMKANFKQDYDSYSLFTKEILSGMLGGFVDTIFDFITMEFLTGYNYQSPFIVYNNTLVKNNTTIPSMLNSYSTSGTRYYYSTSALKNYSNFVNTQPIFGLDSSTGGNYYKSNPATYKIADKISWKNPTEGLTKLELTDSFSVVFKPKYENINSSVDLKFYFLTKHFYDFVWNQNGELFNDLCFAGKELTYRILYDDLDIMNKSDYLEFRRNFNITKEEQSSIGSSGFSHGGGGRHSFGETNYNEETNEIEYTKFENAVIYYQPEFFDYCLKKSESSQCYYEDGRVDDNYFNIYVSEDYGTGEYIESASKFINEQKNYFSVFGSFAKLGFANLPAGLRNALITIVIISLAEGFIMWLRR